MAELKSAGALERRFAKLEDMHCLWLPKTVEVRLERVGEGVFGHLHPTKKEIKEIQLPSKGISWEKFHDRVLPDALGIEVLVPRSGPFYGAVTAVNPEAPPILQWDGAVDGAFRCPVSWYFYYGGSTALNWGLVAGSWARVNGICREPPAWWSDKFKHRTPMAFFILEGARDSGYTKSGLFFPENLRAEYHEIRKVIEQYAATGTISGKDEGTANGIALQHGVYRGIEVRVKTADGGMALYNFTSWD